MVQEKQPGGEEQPTIDPQMLQTFLPIVDRMIADRIEQSLSGINISSLIKLTISELNLPDLIQNSVTAKIDQIGAKVAQDIGAQIQQQMPLRAEQAQPGGDMLSNPLATMILTQLTKGSGGGDSLSQLAQVGEAFGKIVNGLIQPIENLRSQTRNDTLRELTTLSRLPEGFLDDRQSQRNQGGSISLSQDEMKTIASEVARRMRLDAMG